MWYNDTYNRYLMVTWWWGIIKSVLLNAFLRYESLVIWNVATSNEHKTTQYSWQQFFWQTNILIHLFAVDCILYL